MRSFRDEVIVIKSKDYKEADKLLTLYGQNTGKFTVIAKGIRKIESKNRGNMQTLSISKISFYKAEGIPILMETDLIYSPDYAECDIKNIERVLFLVDKFMGEEQGNEKVYKSLESVIRKNVDTSSTNKFRAIFLAEEGLLGDMTECSICGKNESLNYIDLVSFASVCESCYSIKKLSKGIIKRDSEMYSDKIFSEALDRYISNLF